MRKYYCRHCDELLNKDELDIRKDYETNLICPICGSFPDRALVKHLPEYQSLKRLYGSNTDHLDRIGFTKAVLSRLHSLLVELKLEGRLEPSNYIVNSSDTKTSIKNTITHLESKIYSSMLNIEDRKLIELGNDELSEDEIKLVIVYEELKEATNKLEALIAS